MRPPRIRLIAAAFITILIVGCTQAEIDAWQVQNEVLRQDLAEVRAEVRANPDTPPSKVAKIEKRLDQLDSLAAKSKEAADTLEAAGPIETLTDAGQAITPFLPFPWNIVAGTVIGFGGVAANRKRLEIKKRLQVPDPPQTV